MFSDMDNVSSYSSHQYLHLRSSEYKLEKGTTTRDSSPQAKVRTSANDSGLTEPSDDPKAHFMSREAQSIPLFFPCIHSANRPSR